MQKRKLATTQKENFDSCATKLRRISCKTIHIKNHVT